MNPPRHRPAHLRVERLEDRTTPVTLPTGFTETAVATGISSATAMDFAPNGDLWVLEKAGPVKRFRPGSTTADVVGNLSGVGLRTESERGVLGIAFDPAYSTNKFVYLYYTSSDASTPNNRVSRFTVNDANAADYSFVDTGTVGDLDEVVILDLDAHSAGNHNGGAIHFGPDGFLYVATGDNADRNNSQLLTNRHGKILRIDAATGAPAPGNPTSFPNIAGSTTGVNQAIWAVGLRNPYTFAFQPGTGVMHINDVGEGTWEEVNVGLAGRNYGWGTTEGPNPPGLSWVTYPLFAYTHGTGAFQGNAITGGAFYNPTTSQFPSDYAGDYFYADTTRGWVNVVNANGTGRRQFVAVPTGTPNPGTVDLLVGADGGLYYLARNFGQVMRVQYVGPPVVNGVTVNATGNAPSPTSTSSRVTQLVVTFDTAVSADPAQLGPGAFTLTRAGGGTLTNGNGIAVSGYGTRTLTLTFTAATGVESGSLADGVWTLTTDLTKVRTTVGTAGTGTHAAGNIRRLFGDGNGDGLVNLADFGLFGNTFGKGSAAAGFDPAFDFNGDGVINLADFGAFGQRFGKGL